VIIIELRDTNGETLMATAKPNH